MSQTLRQVIRGILREAAITPEAAASRGLALCVVTTGRRAKCVLYDANELKKELEPRIEEFGDPYASESIFHIMLTRAITAWTVGYTSASKMSNPCHSAWEIISSAADHGYGPLMYDVMMSVVPSHTVTSDRLSSSQSARNVWKFYHHSRSDVEKLPFDDIEDPKTPPDDDDCDLYYKKDGEAPKELNFAYRGKKIDVSALEQAHAELIGWIDDMFPISRNVELSGIFETGGTKFFGVNYSGEDG